MAFCFTLLLTRKKYATFRHDWKNGANEGHLGREQYTDTLS